MNVVKYRCKALSCPKGLAKPNERCMGCRYAVMI